MKNKIIILCILTFLLVSPIAMSSPIIKLNAKPVQRGIFQAELGFRNETEGILSLTGNVRNFRGRHIIFGSVTHIESDRSSRFQGFVTRNTFLIQTAVRSNIINVVGRFTSYDEETQEYSGIWSGMAVGIGRTRGWITASFT